MAAHRNGKQHAISIDGLTIRFEDLDLRDVLLTQLRFVLAEEVSDCEAIRGACIRPINLYP